MAAELVSPENYPELEEFELASADGSGGGRFLGRVTASGQPCGTCGTEDTVTVYRGPQHGLAFDQPVTPVETEPIELELSWCARHGLADMRLLTHAGDEHTGL